MASGDNISPEMALKQAYGLYLMHGGSKEDFMELTHEDVQMMYTAYMATMLSFRQELIKDLIKILEKMFKV